MKKLLLLSLLACFSLSLSAQEIFQDTKIGDASLFDIAVADDGYYVLGSYDREWVTNHEWHHAYTGFVAKLDANLNVVFEKKFPESRFTPFHKMTIGEDGIWLVGSWYASLTSDKGQGWLHKMSFDGAQLFDKKMAHSGYHTTEGKQVQTMRNGDVAFTMHLYRNFNSYGHPRIYRFTSNGRELWHKDLEASKALPSVAEIRENEDGSLLLTGHVYETYQDLKSGGAKGWLCHLDGQDPSRVYMNKYVSQWKNITLSCSMELSDGAFWVIGTDRSASRGTTVFMEMDRSGNILRSQEYDYGGGMSLRFMGWLPGAERLVVAGTSYSDEGNKPRGHLMSIDPASLGATQKRFEDDSFQSIHTFDGGEMVLLSSRKVDLLR